MSECCGTRQGKEVDARSPPPPTRAFFPLPSRTVTPSREVLETVGLAALSGVRTRIREGRAGPSELEEDPAVASTPSLLQGGTRDKFEQNSESSAATEDVGADPPAATPPTFPLLREGMHSGTWCQARHLFPHRYTKERVTVIPPQHSVPHLLQPRGMGRGRPGATLELSSPLARRNV